MLEHTEVLFTSLLLIHEIDILLIGTSAGTVRAMLWPLEDEIGKSGNLIKKAEHYEFPVATKAITKMAVSRDLSYLYTTSEDGSVFCLKLTEVKMGID
jgi:hypothetical protein